jgi:hypothetical protein
MPLDGSPAIRYIDAGDDVPPVVPLTAAIFFAADDVYRT